MKILALDFSTSQRAVAVVQRPGGSGPVFQSEIVEAGGRSTRAFSMIEQTLSEARLEREEIECVAVGLGPGSYTGVRAAIALAQGWQLARNVKLLGINTVEVLADRAHTEGFRGAIHLVIDAQRSEFYCATWQLSDEAYSQSEPLQIVTRDEVELRLASGDPVLGPDLKRTFPTIRELFPSALQLGQLAMSRSDFVSGESLKPVYLRQTSFVKAPPPRQI